MIKNYDKMKFDYKIDDRFVSAFDENDDLIYALQIPCLWIETNDMKEASIATVSYFTPILRCYNCDHVCIGDKPGEITMGDPGFNCLLKDKHGYCDQAVACLDFKILNKTYRDFIKETVVPPYIKHVKLIRG